MLSHAQPAGLRRYAVRPGRRGSLFLAVAVFLLVSSCAPRSTSPTVTRPSTDHSARGEATFLYLTAAPEQRGTVDGIRSPEDLEACYRLFGIAPLGALGEPETREALFCEALFGTARSDRLAWDYLDQLGPLGLGAFRWVPDAHAGPVDPMKASPFGIGGFLGGPVRKVSFVFPPPSRSPRSGGVENGSMHLW
mgnify:CR=1 FL=1